MNWLQIFNELFDVAFLMALLAFLILIWRSSHRRETQQQAMMATMIDVARQNAESARIVAEAVRMLAAIIQNEQARDKNE